MSRIALGTGTHGVRHESNQTRLGYEAFVSLAQHAYNAGIIFLDAADMYGSHTYIKEALKKIPRKKVVILSKIWSRSDPAMTTQPASQLLADFLEQLGTDYIDIVLLHCMTSADWPVEMAKYCESLSEAKKQGIIRAHGVSCHSIEALQTAAQNDWVDVLLVRINHSGIHMDDTPEKVIPVLKQAKARGAGVVGMKIFGVGDLIAEDQRQNSLEFVLNSGVIDAMTIGFEQPHQIDDTLQRVNKILKAQKL